MYLQLPDAARERAPQRPPAPSRGPGRGRREHPRRPRLPASDRRAPPWPRSRHVAQGRRPHDPADGRQPRRRGSDRRALRAGRLTSPMAARRRRAPTSRPHVQRCGGVDPATCSCHDGDEGASGEAAPVVARSVASGVVQRALTPDLAQSIARKLENAMSGWGTDEDAIYGALSGRTAADIRRYQERLQRPLPQGSRRGAPRTS